jgi:hypothetical protein
MFPCSNAIRCPTKKSKLSSDENDDIPLKQTVEPSDSMKQEFMQKILDPAKSPLICHLSKPLSIDFNSESNKDVLQGLVNRLLTINAHAECVMLFDHYQDARKFYDLDDLVITIILKEDIQSARELVLNDEEHQVVLLQKLDNMTANLYKELEDRLDAGQWFEASETSDRYFKLTRYGPRMVQKWKKSMHSYPALVTAKGLASASWIFGVELQVKELEEKQGKTATNDMSGLDLLLDIVEALPTKYQVFARKVFLHKLLSRRLTRNSAGSMAAKFGLSEYFIKVKDLVALHEMDVMEPSTVATQPTQVMEHPAIYTSDTPVTFVGDQETLQLLKEALSTSSDPAFVGLDCEWKPDVLRLYDEEETPAAILQLAIESRNGDRKAFVLGLIDFEVDDLQNTLNSLFTSNDILKIGMQIRSLF